MATLTAASAIEIRINVLAFGPVPMTMGNGPMKMAMPELVDELLEDNAVATRIVMPTMTMANPIIISLKSVPKVFD